MTDRPVKATLALRNQKNGLSALDIIIIIENPCDFVRALSVGVWTADTAWKIRYIRESGWGNSIEIVVDRTVDCGPESNKNISFTIWTAENW